MEQLKLFWVICSSLKGLFHFCLSCQIHVHTVFYNASLSLSAHGVCEAIPALFLRLLIFLVSLSRHLSIPLSLEGGGTHH